MKAIPVAVAADAVAFVGIRSSSSSIGAVCRGCGCCFRYRIGIIPPFHFTHLPSWCCTHF